MPQKFPVDSIVPSVRPLLLLMESDNGQLHHVIEAPSDAYRGQLPCCGGPSTQKNRFDTHEQGGQGGGTDDEQEQGAGTCSHADEGILVQPDELLLLEAPKDSTPMNTTPKHCQFCDNSPCLLD